MSFTIITPKSVATQVSAVQIAAYCEIVFAIKINMKSNICYIIIISSGKKYAELHPKKEEKKEKKAKEEKPKQEKAKQEKPKKQEKKKEEPEEEDDAPPPPKFVDPYAGLPKRYS